MVGRRSFPHRTLLLRLHCPRGCWQMIRYVRCIVLVVGRAGAGAGGCCVGVGVFLGCVRACVCACVCGGLCGGQPQYLFETLDSLPPPAPTMQAAELATKRVHGMEVRIEKLTKQVLLPLILPLSSFHPIITSQ